MSLDYITEEPVISLDRFETTLGLYVKSFFEAWRLNQENDPEAYPSEMTEQAWMEQFLVDCSNG
jgi:hypothetical protein